MAKRHDNLPSAQHGHGTIAQHGASSETSVNRSDAQHGNDSGAQHAAWLMDEDGPLGDAYLDAPIPYRLSHEAGVELDQIDARGSVP